MNTLLSFFVQAAMWLCLMAGFTAFMSVAYVICRAIVEFIV